MREITSYVCTCPQACVYILRISKSLQHDCKAQNKNVTLYVAFTFHHVHVHPLWNQMLIEIASNVIGLCIAVRSIVPLLIAKIYNAEWYISYIVGPKRVITWHWMLTFLLYSEHLNYCTNGIHSEEEISAKCWEH